LRTAYLVRHKLGTTTCMPTKHGLEAGHIEDHVKRIARRLMDRRTKCNAQGSRLATAP